jgi:hypothetical protein
MSNIITKKKNKFLFIFDNYIQSENFDCYVDQLSQLENVFILITTIDTNVVEKLKERFKINSKSFNLEPFSLEESENFVKTQLKEKINDENELNRLVSLFDFSGKNRPYVLNKIIASIKLSNEPFSELTQIKHKLTEEYAKDNLFQLLKKDDKTWNLLKYSSFLVFIFFKKSIFLINHSLLLGKNIYISYLKFFSIIFSIISITLFFIKIGCSILYI